MHPINIIVDPLSPSSLPRRTGNVLAFAMECYEKGIITKEDTRGIKLTFGNHEAIITILRKIACGQDLGNILAEGIRKASEIISKGLEPLGYDPRGLKGIP